MPTEVVKTESKEDKEKADREKAEKEKAAKIEKAKGEVKTKQEAVTKAVEASTKAHAELIAAQKAVVDAGGTLD